MLVPRIKEKSAVRQPLSLLTFSHFSSILLFARTHTHMHMHTGEQKTPDLQPLWFLDKTGMISHLSKIFLFLLFLMKQFYILNFIHEKRILCYKIQSVKIACFFMEYKTITHFQIFLILFIKYIIKCALKIHCRIFFCLEWMCKAFLNSHVKKFELWHLNFNCFWKRGSHTWKCQRLVETNCFFFKFSAAL